MIPNEQCIATLKEAINECQVSSCSYFDIVAYVVHITLPTWRRVSELKRTEHVDIIIADDSHPLLKVSYYGQMSLLAYQQICTGCIVYLRNVRLKSQNGDITAFAAADRTLSQVVASAEVGSLIHSQQYPTIASRISDLQNWAKQNYPLMSLRRRDSVVQSAVMDCRDLHDVREKHALIVAMTLYVWSESKSCSEDVEANYVLSATDISGKRLVVHCCTIKQASKLRSMLCSYWATHGNAVARLRAVNALVHRVDGTIRSLLTTHNTTFTLLEKTPSASTPASFTFLTAAASLPLASFISSRSQLQHPLILTQCTFHGLYILNDSGEYTQLLSTDIRHLIQVKQVATPSPPTKRSRVDSSVSLEHLSCVTFDTPPSLPCRSVPQYLPVFAYLSVNCDLTASLYIAVRVSRILGNIPAALAYVGDMGGFDYAEGAKNVLTALHASIGLKCNVTIIKDQTSVPDNCSDSTYIVDKMVFTA